MRHTTVTRILAALLLALVLAGAAAAQEEPGVTYIVREGNTLEQIAEFFDVSLDCLTEGNALDAGEDPEPGTALVIANDCPPYEAVTDEAEEAPTEGQGGGATTTGQAPSGQGGGGSHVAVNGVYVVQRGDKLSLIARDNGVSLICLVVANQIFNPDLIYVGQRITVPDDCARFEQGGGALPGTPAPAPGGGRVYSVQTQLGVRSYVLQSDGTYIVRVTDMLDSIALGFNVDTQCLAASNQIVNAHRLQPGQRLVINFNCPPWSGEPGPRRGQGGGPVG